jgi:hypothetical protein
LSPGEQQNYNEEAAPLGLTGFNLYMQQYMLVQKTLISCTKDTYISEHYNTTNYGQSDKLVLFDMATWVQRILIYFPLLVIPLGSTIVSARIALFYQGESGTPAPSKVLKVHRILASWVETVVTWNNAPSYDASPTSSTTLGDEGRWCYFFVTNDVQDFVDSVKLNHGWLIKFDDEDADPESEPSYSSRQAALRLPYLEVSYY